jgi:uncharacterized membrane protein HdeD (DUF308 family)
MVREEVLRPLPDPEACDLRSKLLVFPEDVRAEDLRVEFEVPVEIRGADVEVRELPKGWRHDPATAPVRISVGAAERSPFTEESVPRRVGPSTGKDPSVHRTTVLGPRTLESVLGPRTLESVLGAFSIAVGFGLMAFPNADVLAVLFWSATVLVLFGIRGITTGIARSSQRRAIRVLEGVSGVAILGLGFVVSVFPGFGVANLFGFLYLGLLAFGVAHVGVGVGRADLPPWFRGYLVSVGTLNGLLGPILVLTPGQPRLVLILLAAVALVVNGVAVAVSARVMHREARKSVGAPPIRGSHP